MSKNLTLNVTEPCTESWNDMTPGEKGRHCSSCEKVIIDFSLMTDAQLVTYFKQASGRTCGRFRTDQLSRPIALSPIQRTSRHLKYLAASMLVMEVLTRNAHAEAAPKADMATIDEITFTGDTCGEDVTDPWCIESADTNCIEIDTAIVKNARQPGFLIDSAVSIYITGDIGITLGFCSYPPDVQKINVNGIFASTVPVHGTAHDLHGPHIDEARHPGHTGNKPRYPLKDFFKTSLAIVVKRLKIKRLPDI